VVRARLPALAVAAFLVAVAASPAEAAAPAASFALVPQHYDPALAATQSYFVAVEHPGETFTNSVRVRNVGTKAGTVLLYPVDATTGKTSGAVYLDRAKPRLGVGSWVTLGASSVKLGPGESAIVPITVRVPTAARPGDHLGGIVAENASLTGATGRGALQIKVRHLTIAAVEVQIPGKTAAVVRIGGAKAGGEHGYQYVYLRLANTGALTTKPTGHLTVTDANGKEVASRGLKLDTFLPGTAIDYPVLLPGKAFEPGDYRANVEITYGAAAIGYRRAPGPTKTISRSLPFTVTKGQYSTVFNGVKPVNTKQQHPAKQSSPPPYVLIGVAAIGALLGGIAVLLVLLRRRAAL
jgi:WxL Interacting Protein, peptidoglycan binding domain